MGFRVRFAVWVRSCGLNSALRPSGVAQSSTSFGWGKGGNVTSAGWQVTRCDPMWHVSSRSGVATLRTAIGLHLLLTYFRGISCRTSEGSGGDKRHARRRATPIRRPIPPATRQTVGFVHWLLRHGRTSSASGVSSLATVCGGCVVDERPFSSRLSTVC